MPASVQTETRVFYRAHLYNFVRISDLLLGKAYLSIVLFVFHDWTYAIQKRYKVQNGRSEKIIRDMKETYNAFQRERELAIYAWICGILTYFVCEWKKEYFGIFHQVTLIRKMKNKI